MQCYENETGARVGAAHKSTRRKPGSKTIAKNQWFVEAQWYRSTSHDPYMIQGSKGTNSWMASRACAPGCIHIQEHELEWAHEGRVQRERASCQMHKHALHVALMN